VPEEQMDNTFNPTRLSRISTVMRRHVESGEVPSLVSLVSRRGETHVEAFGTDRDPAARNSIFRIASLTKMVTAAAAMILVEECRLRLDDPIDHYLPELANRRVLNNLEGSIEDSVPANRSITTRDLLTLKLGLGHIMRPGTFPIASAAREMGILTGPPSPQTMPDPDEWIDRVGRLPLMYQPGEQWMYDIGLDILGVLIARASGMTFDAFLKQRILDPLGMSDTGFFVPAQNLHRFTVCYRKDRQSGEFTIFDDIKTASGDGRLCFLQAEEASSRPSTTSWRSVKCCSMVDNRSFHVPVLS